ncbi:response regulator [Cytobacillus praedii]|uniref:Response regulator n=2 Tax=Cytobacillus praedii TaxID=1742358 RepID=A0A4R1AZF3_9BACI|nr:response regulator [Cytobacillus praedii]TCJ03805.1 response regulator [Cytobacillus praedii]
MLKAILVDDEILALDLLEAMLKENGGVDIIGKFTNPIEGLEIIDHLKPDIVFLDIEMQEMNGIKLAEKLEKLAGQAEIVFVTAYDQYALEAFNVQAADYILKPIDKDRLNRTVQRVSNRRRQSSQSLPLQRSAMEASFLGSFRLTDLQGKPMNWRTKKVKELCAYLIHQNMPIHRDKIMEDLWSEQPQEKASALLHTSVYHLRKELKNRGFHEAIRYVDERYSFVIDISSDVLLIKQILKLKQFTSKDVKMLLSFYTGDYLVEEDYYWSINEREQLRIMMTQYLRTFINITPDEKKSDHVYKEAIEKLIDLDPWEEHFTRELIHYYIQQGNKREAINVYDKYKTSLWIQLGINPSKILEDMIKNIK